MLHLKLAWRQLIKNRFFTGINLLGLTLGVATALALMLFVQKENSFDSYHTNAADIYRVNLRVPDGDVVEHWGNAPNITGPAVTATLPEVVQFARILHHDFGGTASLSIGEDTYKEERLFWADSTLLEVLDIPLVSGDPAHVLERPNTVLLSVSTAKRYFGDANPVGQEVVVDNVVPLEVTGVFADMPDNSSYQMNLLGSFRTLGWATRRLYWSNASFETLLLTAPGTEQKLLDEKIQKVLESEVEEEGRWFELYTQKLTDIHLQSVGITEVYTVQMGNAEQVRLIGILAFIVLLLACFNYINLTTARAQNRLREVGISKAVGATSRNMVGRFLVETALLSGVALVFSLGLLAVLEPALSRLTDRALTWEKLFTGHWWLALPLVWGGVTLVAGLYPALALGTQNAKHLMTGDSRRSSGQQVLRKVLVVGQFVACITLVAVALLLREQIEFLGSKNLGYDKEAIVAVQLGGSRNEPGKAAYRQAVAQLPWVDEVSRTQSFPGIGTSGYSIPDRNNPEFMHSVAANSIEPGVETLLELNLLAGQFLKQRAAEDTIVHLIANQAFIQTLGYDDPEAAIGLPVRDLFRNPAQIVGVVEDFHYESLHHAIGAYVFHDGDYASHDYLLVSTKAADLRNTLPQLNTLLTQHLPDAAFDYQLLDQTVASFYANENRLSRVVTWFTLLTIIISVLGLLGLATYAAARRNKEISIRKILGASVGGIIFLLSKDFMRLVLLAVIIAVPLGWWIMNNWLENFAYRITIQWWVFLLAGGLALLVAIFTIAGQSWRAATRNPVDSLRSE